MGRAYRSRPTLLAALMLLAFALTSNPASASNHVPPRLALKVGASSSERYNLLGEWWGYGGYGCSPIAIDPAPRPPRPFEVPSGRHRMAVVLHTSHRPERIAVRIFRRGESRNIDPRLRPRRSPGGEVSAWTIRFRAHVRNRVHVFPFAGWRDERGCGREYIEAHFPLRGT